MSELQRYGIEWTGPSTPICVEKADGYWTPWHVAQAELAVVRAAHDAMVRESLRMARERDALRAAVKKAVPALEDMGDAFARMAHPTLSSIVSEQLTGLCAALAQEGGR